MSAPERLTPRRDWMGFGIVMFVLIIIMGVAGLIIGYTS